MCPTKITQFYLIIFIFIIKHLNYSECHQSLETLRAGESQYLLLKERVNLPKYGNCWKSAVDQIDEGCSSLSEESQSNIALILTNCFLEMSGHETYNCESNVKQNLRRICISSMSDRAFHVYTEFYTHTHNICTFLKNQLWQEIMTENALRVGESLEISNEKQTEILLKQAETVSVQEKLLNFSTSLEKTLQISKEQADKVFVSIQKASAEHQKLLLILSHSLDSIQSWLIGEVSWLDTMCFYISFAILVTLFTSTKRTVSARLILYLLLTLNAALERIISSTVLNVLDFESIDTAQEIVTKYVWLSRKITIFISLCIFVISLYVYKDYNVANNQLLLKIELQNSKLASDIKNIVLNSSQANLNNHSPLNNDNSKQNENEVITALKKELRKFSPVPEKNIFSSFNNKIETAVSPSLRYNLRSRTCTPESTKP